MRQPFTRVASSLLAASALAGVFVGCFGGSGADDFNEMPASAGGSTAGGSAGSSGATSSGGSGGSAASGATAGEDGSGGTTTGAGGAAPCTEAADCSGGLLCDVDLGECVECLLPADCDDGETCTNGACAPVTGACGGLNVLLLVPRSGYMFDSPDGDWWTALRAALLDGDQSVLAKYGAEADLGMRAFFRVTSSEGAECPQAHDASDADASAIEALLDDAEAENAAAVDDQLKIDAPTPEAIAAAAADLAALPGKRAIVLLMTATWPDSCTSNDSNCAMHQTIAAAQAAYEQGIGLHVVALGPDPGFPYMAPDALSTLDYWQALANAGAGEPVFGPPDNSCGGETLGEYADIGGSAAFHQALAPENLAAELDAAFAAATTCD